LDIPSKIFGNDCDNAFKISFIKTTLQKKIRKVYLIPMTDDIKLSIAVIVGTLLLLVGIVGVAKVLDKTSQVPIDQTIGDRRNFKGNKDAANVIVEFSDFECPACALAYSTVDQLIADYPSDLNIEFRHYPLPQHTKATQAAYAAEAAGKQGKFWEAHDWLFSNQAMWQNAEISAEYFYDQFGENLSLDKDQFIGDYNSSEIAQFVDTDLKAGQNLRISSTPTFYVNGKEYAGVLQYQDWVKLLSLPDKPTITSSPTITPEPTK